ncbi:MAG: 3-oxoacyl-ACP synthase, partial [Desulfobacca sp.]|nr:3-oxoacyl-ACP synthase [Desulfobacca sp.]
MKLLVTRHLHLQNNRVMLNGILESALKEQSVGQFLRSIYRHYTISYPKFYKMDNLCKLGFLSAEILLQGTDILRNYPEEDIGIILGNASSSLDSDEKHQESIQDRSSYFPSPSVFVYTLANIMAGEIAIRH